MANQNIESYYSICLNDKVTQLFNNTILGVDYWKKHKHQRCYKCREKGHLADVCEDVCIYCKNYHPGLPVCLFKMYQFIEKIYKTLEKNSEGLVGKYEKIIQEENKINKMLYDEKQNEMQKEYNEENSNKFNDDLCKYVNNNKINIINNNKFINLNINKNFNVNIDFVNNVKFITRIAEFKIKDKNYEEKLKEKKNKYYGDSFFSWMWKATFIDDNKKNFEMKRGVNVFLNKGLSSTKSNHITNEVEFQAYAKRLIEENKEEERNEKLGNLTIGKNKEYEFMTKEEYELKKYKEKLEKEKKERKEKFKKELNERLKKLKEYKEKIEKKDGFESEKYIKEIRKIKDIARIIKNLKYKEDNVRDRIDDLYRKMEDKKEILQDIKDRIDDAWEEKERILNAARRKGERIKQEAYGKYRAYFVKKNHGSRKANAYEKEIYEEQNRESKYDDEYFEMMNDDRIGEYDDDPHIMDYECNADF